MASRARALVALAVLATSAACASAPTEEETVTAADGITVTSSAFADGGDLPIEYTCDGEGGVPPLAWTGVPADAAALALVVDDPDAPRGTFTHWVVVDLPPETQEIVDGVLPVGAVEAGTSGGTAGWYPPCPPSGTHRYRFTVYALGRPTGVPAGTDLGTALAAVRDAAVAQGRLTGLYARRR